MEAPAFFVYVFSGRIRAIPLTHIAELTLYMESIDIDLSINKNEGGARGDFLARLATTHPLSTLQAVGAPPIILRGSIAPASDLLNQLRRPISYTPAVGTRRDAAAGVVNGDPS